MEVYVLTLKNEGEIYINVFKDNSQIRKKLIKLFNEEYGYELYPEDRDELIDELFEHHYATGDMIYDFGEYYLEKHVVQ